MCLDMLRLDLHFCPGDESVQSCAKDTEKHCESQSQENILQELPSGAFLAGAVKNVWTAN